MISDIFSVYLIAAATAFIAGYAAVFVVAIWRLGAGFLAAALPARTEERVSA